MMLVIECNKESAYLAIIITAVPLWAIVTTLVVLLLITFHKNLRATHVYENCTKNTALYTYLIEVRTGDTSSSYNRRKTTLTIDMFDDHQNTLTRLGVPGHVIFGKKESPVAPIEDERYFDLRITRFWLHRPIRLKRPLTLRLTHTCLETDARIMIYAVQIKGRESHYKIFFPVMTYISAYGSALRPNACFDSEPQGSISAVGGEQPETICLSDHLTWTDCTVLFYFFSSVAFIVTCHENFLGQLDDTVGAIFKGANVGVLSFLVVLLFGLILKYIIKLPYARNLGFGPWSYVYYVYLIILMGAGTGLWAGTTITGYKMCNHLYKYWLLAIATAYTLSGLLYLTMQIFIWIGSMLNPKYVELNLPDEPQQQGQIQQGGAGAGLQQMGSGQPMYGEQQVARSLTLSARQRQRAATAPGQQPGGYGALQVGAPGGMTGQSMGPTGGQQLPYSQSGTMISGSGQGAKGSAGGAMMMPPAPGQFTNMAAPGSNSGTGPRKTGSQESTGSTYYHQVMKARGGVKSISQYGELLRQKKTTNPNSQTNR